MRVAEWFGAGSFVSYSTLSFTPRDRTQPDYVTIVASVRAAENDTAQVTWEDAPAHLPSALPIALFEAHRLQVVAADGALVWTDNTGLNLPRDGARIVGPGWSAHREDPTARVRVGWHELEPSDIPSFVAEITRWSRPREAIGNATPLPSLLGAGGGASEPPEKGSSVASPEPPEDEGVGVGPWSSVEETTGPTALLSWAHSHEGWTPDQVEGWEKSVVALASLLREIGINVDIDLMHEADIDIDWTRWGSMAVETSDHVFIVMSKGWAERWQGTNSPTLGAGAVAEADSLHGVFARNQLEFQRRTKVILLPGVTPDDIPADLRRLTYFKIDPKDPASADGLLRHVTNQPTYRLPPVGPLRRLDTASVRSDASTRQLVARLEELADAPESEDSDEGEVHRVERASIEQTLALRGLGVGDLPPVAPSPAHEDEQYGEDRATGEVLLRRVRTDIPGVDWVPGRCARCARAIAVERDSDDEWVCSKRCHDRWFRMLYSVIDPDSEEELKTKVPRVVPYWL